MNTDVARGTAREIMLMMVMMIRIVAEKWQNHSSIRTIEERHE